MGCAVCKEFFAILVVIVAFVATAAYPILTKPRTPLAPFFDISLAIKAESCIYIQSRELFSQAFLDN